MDGFALLVVGFIVLTVLAFLAIGAYHPKSGAEVLDWKPMRSHEDEVRLEFEDVDQMLEAQNERRRRSGRAELTEEQVQAQVELAQREQRERSRRYEG